MCRNIKKLRQPERPPTQQEYTDAALQYVRKITGYRKPSRANQAAFDQAVTQIAAISEELFQNLTIKPK